jgi:hypothetical protein
MPVRKQQDLNSKEVAKTPVMNKFAVLDMSSDDEENTDVIEEVEEHSSTSTKPVLEESEVRVWKLEAPVEAGSIFSRTKKYKNKKKDDDGWTSIVWNRPRFVNEDDEERKIKEELIAEANLPTTPKYTEEDLEASEKVHKTTLLAKEWAAKIQADLERVETNTKEKRRTELSDDFVASLGKLSFFRKPMVVSS